jgi:hypothetical protein
MIFFNMMVFGQTSEEVDQIEFFKELQIWNKKADKMSFSFWMPQSYWRITLKDNPSISEEIITSIETMFENYLVLCAADIIVSANPSSTNELFTYKDESTLRSELKFIDFAGDEHFPFSNDKVPSDIGTVLASLTPIFIQIFGEMGEGMHLYLFDNTDSNNQLLISKKKSGEFIVKHSNEEFKWTLPLVSLLPDKYCPTDNEKMKGNWKYCPIHGVELE